MKEILLTEKEMVFLFPRDMFGWFPTCLMDQSVNLVWNIAVYKVGCVFAYFWGGHKNNFRLWSCRSFMYMLRQMWKNA